jgi:hypothetical protein
MSAWMLTAKHTLKEHCREEENVAKAESTMAGTEQPVIEQVSGISFQ